MSFDRNRLSRNQAAFYAEHGYLVLDRRVPSDIIARCHAEIDRFEQEARGLDRSNDRLDLENSHTPECPRIRRIKLPHKLSPVFASLMRSDWILAPVRDLIGPNLRLHTSKLNVKAAQYGASVDWHQDFAFYPHTNDDVLAVGVMLDDVTLENGPLMVFPGSNRGPIHDHHSDGVFAGTMSLGDAGLDTADAVRLTGPAGSISIHHVRLVHGSALNRSNQNRSILFYEITAADAFPIAGAMSEFSSLADYDQKMLCGESTIQPRLKAVPVRIPQPQPSARGSIYEVQESSAKRGFEYTLEK